MIEMNLILPTSNHSAPVDDRREQIYLKKNSCQNDVHLLREGVLSTAIFKPPWRFISCAHKFKSRDQTQQIQIQPVKNSIKQDRFEFLSRCYTPQEQQGKTRNFKQKRSGKRVGLLEYISRDSQYYTFLKGYVQLHRTRQV